MQLSILAAFLGGLISLLTPCSAMVIPTFAAVASKKISSLVLTTLAFSLGLLITIFPLGLSAHVILTAFFSYRQTITLFLGWVLTLFGALTIFDHHLPFINISAIFQNQKRTGYTAIVSLGIIAGLGSTTCVGPILGAILSLAALSSNYVNTFALLTSYSLGMIIPLVIFALVYDKFVSLRLSQLKHRTFHLGRLNFNLINLISGTLLILIGTIFIRYQGSLAAVPLFYQTGLMDTFFNWQDALFGW